ncbi:unnamed protein product, partial [Choristocarpus tenellus]
KRERWSVLRDIAIAVRVFFWCGLFVNGQWRFPLLLACSAASYEVVASTVMNIIGDFYEAISSQDADLFVKQVLWRSLLVVTSVAFLKALRDLAEECCALQWRRDLVAFLHTWYLRGSTPYVLATAEWGSALDDYHGRRCGGRRSENKKVVVDNPDQRIVSDSTTLTTAFAKVAHDTMVIPGLVVYYTWYLLGMFGWTAPAACYLFFVLASLTNWVMVKKVVPAVYTQERAEGTYRYDHAWLRSNAESIAFYGPEAVEGREQERLGKSFAGVVRARWLVIRRHLPLYFTVQFFDYLGSIINYAAVGAAILYLSKASSMSEAEISSLVARGSYSCLYLINAFSQAFKASEAASRVGGSATRVVELLVGAGFTPEDSLALGPWS